MCYIMNIKQREATHRMERAMKNITINIEGLGFWSLVNLHGIMSEATGNDSAMDELTDHIRENRREFERAAAANHDNEALEAIDCILGVRFHEWLLDNDAPQSWDIVEEAARVISKCNDRKKAKRKTKALRTALELLSGSDPSDIMEFLNDYAGEWYCNGKRL